MRGRKMAPRAAERSDLLAFLDPIARSGREVRRAEAWRRRGWPGNAVVRQAETIAAALSEPRDAIEEVIEPYLLQQGLILRTPRGRMLGQKAWRHLGLEAPKMAGQADLFGGS